MTFIEFSDLPPSVIDKNYDLSLVILSIIVAIVSFFAVINISERIQTRSSFVQNNLWIIFGAVVLGVGIWAMQFIATLALVLPFTISYSLKFFLISAAPIVLACAVVLWAFNQSVIGWKKLFVCGAVLGLGLEATSYIGIEALVLSADILYIKPLFVLSIVVAVVFSSIIFKMKHSHYQWAENQVLSSLIMGVVVSGIHYLTMCSIVFIPTNIDHLIESVDASILSNGVTYITFALLISAFIIPHLCRFNKMAIDIQKHKEDLKIAAIAFETHEGILITNSKVEIVRVNKAFTRITGYSEPEVIGKNPRILQSGKHDKLFYKKCWDTTNKDGEWSGEIWDRKKNGEIFPVWQTITAVKGEHNEITNYISIISDITEFKTAEKKIETLAFYDALTNLPNRRLLIERLEHELNIARRYDRAGMLFFLDLDHFKTINDSLGHSIGDQLLIETALRLQSLIRASDTAVRLGGDEFVILVGAEDGIHSDLLEQSTAIAEKILKAINSPFIIGKHELFISTSIGITLYTGLSETAEVLLKRADTAMYQAKDAGRNTFRFYHKRMQEAVDTKLKIEKNLRSAILKNELSIHYQPQLSGANKIVGAEALIRWSNPELGNVSPVDFIPIAEETGLIISIGEWVIETVCLQIKEWDKEGVNIPHIAINISAKQFHRPKFVSTLMQSVYDLGVPANRVMLEITEGVFLGCLEEAIDKMNVLKNNGFSFSIDDFGTGYSSLTYLKRLPFDQLKIDQSFVKGLLENKTDVAIVKAIVVMAKSMGLNLIAEGVETDKHLDYLAGFGCHYYQGYYFSRPLTVEMMTAFVKNHDESLY